MKMFQILTSLSIILLGCSSTHMNQPSAPINYTANAHLNADLDIGGKIEGSAKATQILWFINIGPNKFADGVSYTVDGNDQIYNNLHSSLFDHFSYIKSAAAYNAVSGANADVIIGPRYSIEVNDYFIFKVTKASVSGYKGIIKSFSNGFRFNQNMLR